MGRCHTEKLKYVVIRRESQSGLVLVSRLDSGLDLL